MTKTRQPLYYHPYLFIITLLSIAISSCSERFAHTVQQVPPPAEVSAADFSNYKDSTIYVAAGPHYGRSRLHTFFYGKHYRDVWTLPVEVPVLDIGTAHGGLTPMKLGGSRQTINLRLQDTTGTEYVLRSIDKEPASALPEKWQQSYVANIVRDATSATHPYAALTLPAMAEALGMYYVEPELVYVPHDVHLGEFMAPMGGTVALLERRPTGDQTDYAPMGRAVKVKSTRSALAERLTDNDTYFDARFYLRARLLDMLIGDWSRHEDNWRWAEIEHDENAYTYKAVPRDRDNIFYRLNDGPIPWLFMQLDFKPHFQTFRSKLKNVEKLNSSGRNLDELILAELEWQDWEEVADSVQRLMTDEVIEKGFQTMPDNIAALSAPDMTAKLKSRRNQLLQAASKYYNALAANVQVVGTDKKERFEVEVVSEEEVRVRMFKIKREEGTEQQLYFRTFRASETDEIRLYGLNGKDQFYISGSTKPGIRIKIWGGAGEDNYQVEAKGSKLGKRIYINDTLYRNEFNVDKYTAVDIDNNQRAKDFDAAGWLLRYYLD
ncbi:hypothetical protein DXT99_19695 [Pontibacter diazotrophicus]|uniref:Uncharacterized protein n=1 Tax=Pontibacter diazotrophicus TaxID=1400979 RepID=A0A3D8L7Z6_9BACT|nr:hypothetical protein [Pontibacter diazotrophicus]RDV13416.1 hypothetical protein DXT99_19695 [Pontibacter diazotrophicus]